MQHYEIEEHHIHRFTMAPFSHSHPLPEDCRELTIEIKLCELAGLSNLEVIAVDVLAHNTGDILSWNGWIQYWPKFKGPPLSVF